MKFNLCIKEDVVRATLQPVVPTDIAATSGKLGVSGANAKRHHLLGLDFANLNAAEAARLISERAQNDPFAYVVTPNADHLSRLFRNPSLVPIYQGAWFCLLDSRVVAAGAQLLGLPTPQVATGSDVTRLLLSDHLRPGERITIVGLEPDWLPSLVARCGLAQPAHCFPPMGFDERPETLDAVVNFVVANPARLMFIAVGSPRQERLCAALANTGKLTGTALCVGASLEFLSGKRSRAPLFVQRLCFEWLYRLTREPRKLSRRYFLDCPPVFLHLLRERNLARLNANRPIERFTSSARSFD